VYFQCFFQYCASRGFTTFFYHNWIKLCVALTFFYHKSNKRSQSYVAYYFSIRTTKGYKITCTLRNFVSSCGLCGEKKNVVKKCGRKKSFVVSLHRVNECTYPLQRCIWIYTMTQVNDVFTPKLADHFVCILPYFSG